MPTLMILIIILIASGNFGLGLLIAAVGVIGLPLLTVLAALNPSEAQRAAQEAANDRYERQWYCYQCGTLFQRENERSE